jgi:G3E family GTPase
VEYPVADSINMDSRQPPHIPITVFTGFLGAGKTSIILSLLPLLPKDYKVVLLKNEFGDVQGMYNLHNFPYAWLHEGEDLITLSG